LSTEQTSQSKPSPALPEYNALQVVVYHLTGILLKIFFKVFGRVKIIGLRENVPAEGPVLLCANHTSNLDPPLAWAAFYGFRRIRGVAKIELWGTKFSSYLMNAHGAISVNRGTADRAMFRQVLDGLAAGHAIGIFPEGTRSHDGKLNPGQPGIGLLVLKSGAPVVPVAFLGTYQMLPKGSKKLKPGRVTLIAGKPLTFTKADSKEAIADRIMAEIAALMTAHGVPTEAPGPERAALLASLANTDD
jgi:1-acyl-sn-glycerol-3-phosphate acyltransferase